MTHARKCTTRWSKLQQSVKERERRNEKHSDTLYVAVVVTPTSSVAVVPNPDIITLEGVL